MKMGMTMKTGMRSVAVLFVVAVLAWPSVASAQKKRIGVAKFNGQQEAVVRNRVMQALRFHGFDLVKSRELENAAKSLGISLDSNDSFKALAKELSLSAIVTGDVGKKKAKLTVRGGQDGAVSGEGAFTGANPAKIATDTTKTIWRKLGPAISRGKPPSGAKAPSKAAVAEAPEDKEEAAPAEAEESDDKAEGKEEKAAPEEKADKGDKVDKEEKVAEEEDQPKKKKKKKKVEADADEEGGASGSSQTALDAEVGGRFFSRKLAYNQDVNKSLRQYELKLASALGAAFVWYPAAHGSGGGFIANIGLDIEVEQAFGITSKLGAMAAYPTIIHDYFGGARIRLPMGPANIAGIVGFGEHAYKLASGPNADRTMLDLPDTIYRYVKLGAALRIPMGSKLALMAGGGYRLVLSPGQIKTAYFTRATVGGMDAHAALGYRITPSIEARAGFDLRRYFYSMHSRQGDRYVAGGAVDQYQTFTISLAFMLGGDGGDPADNAEKVAKRHDDDDDADEADKDADKDDSGEKKRKQRG
jgi:hypothetical protein